MHPSGDLLLRSGASRRTTVPYHSRAMPPCYTLPWLEGADAELRVRICTSARLLPLAHLIRQ
jgi:hypothetical protein